jgi:hypothetical protein
VQSDHLASIIMSISQRGEADVRFRTKPDSASIGENQNGIGGFAGADAISRPDERATGCRLPDVTASRLNLSKLGDIGQGGGLNDTTPAPSLEDEPAGDKQDQGSGKCHGQLDRPGEQAAQPFAEGGSRCRWPVLLAVSLLHGRPHRGRRLNPVVAGHEGQGFPQPRQVDLTGRAPACQMFFYTANIGWGQAAFDEIGQLLSGQVLCLIPHCESRFSLIQRDNAAY